VKKVEGFPEKEKQHEERGKRSRKKGRAKRLKRKREGRGGASRKSSLQLGAKKKNIKGYGSGNLEKGTAGKTGEKERIEKAARKNR